MTHVAHLFSSDSSGAELMHIKSLAHQALSTLLKHQGNLVIGISGVVFQGISRWTYYMHIFKQSTIPPDVSKTWARCLLYSKGCARR